MDEQTINSLANTEPAEQPRYDNVPPQDPYAEDVPSRRRFERKKIKRGAMTQESILMLIWICAFGALLAAAPWITSAIQYTRPNGDPVARISYYIPLAISVLPMVWIAVRYKPESFWFHGAAPVLPVALYFALQATAKRPGLFLLVFIGFAGPLCFHMILHNSKAKEQEDEVLHRKKVLNFGIVFITAVLLVTAALGIGLPDRTPPPLDAPLLQVNEYDEVIIALGEWPQGKGSRELRYDILQKLLRHECLKLGIPVLDIRDASVKSIKQNGASAVATARRTKEDQLRQRVALMCYIARLEWLQAQEGKEKVTKDMRIKATTYAEDRAPYYVDQVLAGE